MRRHCLLAPTIMAAALTACNFGQRPESFPPAVGPAGAQISVRVRGETIDRVGELYAVDSAGVLLRGNRLLRVRWSEIAAMDVKGMRGEYDVAQGESVGAAKRARLATVSRFPQGLAGPLLDRVLALIPQPAVDSLP